MNTYPTLSSLNLKDKIIFLRTDMNVPIKDGAITDTTRIDASLKSINYCVSQGAKVIIATHLGRPVEGEYNEEYSVEVICKYLNETLELSIPLVNHLDKNLITRHFDNTSPIVMLENVRFNIGEKQNSDKLGKEYASLCDIFIHDAFATSHRKEASTFAIGKYTQEVGIGLLVEQELNALFRATQNPQKPVIAIVGGSKVSSKLAILNNLIDIVDTLIVGGGILNTFLKASGADIGKSLHEPELVMEAKKIMLKLEQKGATLPLPQEVVVATELSNNAIAYTKNIQELESNDMILDISESFATQLKLKLNRANTIIWNGPVGAFEFEPFAKGTEIIAHAVAESGAFSLSGGGDTIAAINKYNLFDKISYVSTAGGALLEYLGGIKLPIFEMLEARL